ncbi:hypothetical protein PsYK624_154330 [Phanerochaete sordida]|uniref:Uncharacterized protein n=1 Tax=Phanerochaete sordida TaxID=48140 RepID=A0A9P3GPA3_9APHY|nr:hypothetical protein PsYK624_154330 [Phanerochaete sordida]
MGPSEQDGAPAPALAPETRPQQPAGGTRDALPTTPQTAAQAEAAKDRHMAELAGLRAQLLDIHHVFNSIYRRGALALASSSAAGASAPAASAPKVCRPRPPCTAAHADKTQAPAPPAVKQEAEALTLFFQRSTERPAQLQRETALADANAQLRDDVARLRAQAAALGRTLDEERDAAMDAEAAHHAELARLHKRIAEEKRRNAELQAEVRVHRSSAEGRVERGRRE